MKSPDEIIRLIYKISIININNLELKGLTMMGLLRPRSSKKGNEIASSSCS
jgi:hypothetical protein